MKKTTRFLTMLVLTAIVVSMFTGFALAETVHVIATASAHIRKGPGLDYASISTVEKGAKLTYANKTARDDRGVIWYKVKNSSNKVGWISSRMSRLGSDEKTSKVVTASDGQCYVRTSPDRDARSIGVMQKGDKAAYLNKTSYDYRGVAWYKVKFNGKAGWVSSKYCTLSGKPASAKVVANGDTYLRSAPSLDGNKIMTMTKGTSGAYQHTKKKDYRGVVWYKVKYKGKIGWVSSKYTDLK